MASVPTSITGTVIVFVIAIIITSVMTARAPPIVTATVTVFPSLISIVHASLRIVHLLIHLCQVFVHIVAGSPVTSVLMMLMKVLSIRVVGAGAMVSIPWRSRPLGASVVMALVVGIGGVTSLLFPA